MVFASTVIPGFNLLEIHEQDFSLLDTYVFKNGASTSTREVSVFLYRGSGSGIIACLQSGCLAMAVSSGSIVPVLRKHATVLHVEL
jgi:hypothetical protein